MFNKTLVSPKGKFLFIKKVGVLFLCNPLMGSLLGVLFKNRIPHRGCRIEVPQRGGGRRLNAYLFWGLYESAEIRFVTRYLDPRFDVVELGASIGGVSCQITRKMSKDKHLVCVEANPQILDVLKRNLNHNSPGVNYQIVFGAISYGVSKTIGFSIGDDHLSSKIDTHSEVVNVPCLQLSNILEEKLIDEYNLVCDIEGAEVELFHCDSQAFSGCKVLIIETHSCYYQGVHFTTESIIELIKRTTKLHLQARYGNVCVFTKT